MAEDVRTMMEQALVVAEGQASGPEITREPEVGPPCPNDGQPCACPARLRRRCEDDAKRRARREADRARRGNPQRFTLTGMTCRSVPDGEGGTELMWSLDDIDPPLEQDEVIEVVEAGAYERDVFRLAQEAAELRATLSRVMGRVAEAERLLTPGMRAGTAEAKAILRETVLLQSSPDPKGSEES